MFSFIHAADLHLGMRTTRFAPAVASAVREARFAAFDRLRAEARARNVDCLIVAGDLFDDSAVDAHTSRRAFDMLAGLDRPVFVLPGNHDPLAAGGVWDRPPWKRADGGHVQVLRQSAPLEIVAGVFLFPCPVLRKTSLDDPTRWIAAAPETGAAVRIGVAHGSLKTRDDLPRDDHLIALDAADALGLDYLALGHWHKRQAFTGRDGIERTAYSGVHEPMRFVGSTEARSGWIAYGGDGREDFEDAGRGEVWHVRITARGAPPVLEPVDVGHLSWRAEHHEVSSRQVLDALIHDVANRDRLERRMLRIKLSGVLDAESMLRLDTLRTILENRCRLGELDTSSLHIQPTGSELEAAAGEGVLRGVLNTLRGEAAGVDATAARVAERAILLLYQIAREADA